MHTHAYVSVYAYDKLAKILRILGFAMRIGRYKKF